MDDIRGCTQDEIDLMNGSDAYQNRDFAMAVRLYTRSAEAGNITAMSNLGYCYYYGRSIPVDKMKAKECWEKAAQYDDICATYKLGDMYRNGDIPVELEKSKELYMKAFDMALDNGELWNCPDACLRVMKYCRDEFSKEDMFIIAENAVEGLKIRIEEGDTFSNRVLKDAESIYEELKKDFIE